MSQYSQSNDEELADWIRAIGRWKTRQRRLKNEIKAVEDLLREREELVEEALWMRATAGSGAEMREADQALSRAVAMAQSEHESTIRALEAIREGLESTQVGDLFERPRTMRPPTKDPVEEASRESFPASDPPSFNPGRA